MRKTFLSIGDIVGRPTVAQMVLKNLDSHLARLKNNFQKSGLAGSNYIFVQTSASSAGSPVFSVHGRTSMVSQIIDRLGLVNYWTAPAKSNGFTNISFEELTALKPNNFIYVSQKENNPFEDKNVQPLWKNLEFVKSGHVYALDERTWVFGGPLSAQVLADEIYNKMKRK